MIFPVKDPILPPQLACLAGLFLTWGALLGPVQAAPLSLTVTNDNDSGVGSLRQALTDANANAGSTVVFNIPGSGTQTILLSSDLPAITGNTWIDAGAEPVVIDGQGSYQILDIQSGVTVSGLQAANGPATGISIDNGTLVLDAGSLASSGLQLNGGSSTLEVTASGSSTVGGINGGGAVTLDPGAFLDFGGNNLNTSYLGTLNGAATIEKSGTGNTLLSTANVDLFILQDGTLTLQGAFGASTAVSVVSGGVLDMRLSENPTLPLLEGSGTVSFGGSNLIIGTTNQDSTFSGTLVGVGTVEKTGTGIFTLDGNNLTSGGVSVNQGTLLVGDAAHPGAVVTGAIWVPNLAVLEGFGTVQGSVTVGTNGTIDPAGPGGTLRVGSLFEDTGANTAIELNPTDSSHIVAAGNAQLDGPLTLAAALGTYGVHYAYQVVSAGSITGTFPAAFVNLAYMTPDLAYGSNAVTVFLNRTGFSFKPLADTDNGKAVAAALDDSLLSAGNGFGAKLNEIYFLSSGQSGVLGQLAGAIYPSLPAFLMENTRFETDLLFQHLDETSPSRGMAPANQTLSAIVDAATPAADAVGRSSAAQGFWLQSMDSFGSWTGDQELPDFSLKNFGFMAGYDRELEPRMRVGVEGAFSHGDLTANDASAQAGVDSYQAALYAKSRLGAAQAILLLGGAVNHFNSSRILSVGSDVNDLVAAFSGKELTAAFQIGESFDFSGVPLEFFAGAEYAHLSQDAFTETGSALALQAPAQNEDSLRPFLGLGLHQAIDLGGQSKLVPAMRFSISREALNPQSQTPMTFADSGASSFASTGFAEDSTLAGMDLGASLFLSPQAEIFAGFDFNFGSSESLSTFKGGVNLDF
jgi:autotransporter-associated beta strand protein